MAITTDSGAKKIESTENWRNIFDIHNDTVDAYDALAEQKDEEIGIVVKGNKTAHTDGAAAGQYIILRNSTITGCDDGLYKAAQAIPYDTAIDSTYLTPVSGGGLNALNASLKPVLLATITNQTPQTTISIIEYAYILVVSGNSSTNVGEGAITPVSVFTEAGANQLIQVGKIGGTEYVLSGQYSNGSIVFSTPASGTYRIYGIG